VPTRCLIQRVCQCVNYAAREIRKYQRTLQYRNPGDLSFRVCTITERKGEPRDVQSLHEFTRRREMPLDINLFRAYSGGNPDLIRESQRRRYAPVEIVDEIIAKDEQWRKMTGDVDNLRKKRNAVQKEVGTKMKAKEACDDLVAQIKAIGDEITKVEEEQKRVKIEVDRLVGKVGNIVEDGVPISQDEDADNRVERKWGTPRDPAGLLNHHDLLWRIGGYEPERGSAVAGHRGYFLRDVGVLLNQAFINYGIAFLRKRGYVSP
jgi:seryl-tRNA synthetase